jgi:TPR repeat protein
MCIFGVGTKKSTKQGVFWYKKSAQLGHTGAISELGKMYFVGLAVKKSYKKALFFFKMAIRNGCSNAQFWLGYMYLKGYGVEKNNAAALKYFRLAAHQGQIRAQCYLGDILIRKTPDDSQNIKEALSWYGKAAMQEDPVAQYKLARVLTYTKNKKEAAAWYSLEKIYRGYL